MIIENEVKFEKDKFKKIKNKIKQELCVENVIVKLLLIEDFLINYNYKRGSDSENYLLNEFDYDNINKINSGSGEHCDKYNNYN